MKEDLVNLNRVTVEASGTCQLKCPSCPTAAGETGAKLGRGFLSFERFKAVVDAYPHIAQIELSNWGEMLLNRDLPRMLKYAYRRNVGLFSSTGVNFNHAPDEVLDALARWKFRALNCSIDGASPETYRRYRVGGDLNRVIGHIRTLNAYKRKYGTGYPKLNWQFILFGHNEHEVDQARALAAKLGMTFRVKLSWEDFYGLPHVPVRDRNQVRRLVGAADRDEYLRRHHRDYAAGCCIGLWNNLRINHDGRVLGCSINFWDDYGNAFSEGLEAVARGEKIEYARGMLKGANPPRSDIPCTACKVYETTRAQGAWLTAEDIRPRASKRKRRHYRLENKILGEATVSRLLGLGRRALSIL